MKKGDIVTTCYKGIHKIMDIEDILVTEEDIKLNTFNIRDLGKKIKSIVYTKVILTEEGIPPARNTFRNCNIIYCKPIQEYITKEENRINLLKSKLNIT